VRWGMRTILLVYVLELVYLGLLFVDHTKDARHMRDVVGHMAREYRK
jgi:hypothetical protein